MRRPGWLAALALAGCHQDNQQHERAEALAPINAPARPGPVIAATSAASVAASPAAKPPEGNVHFVATGTEPFWSADVAAGSLRYATPEIPDGVSATVTEAKDGTGMRYSGTLQGQALDLLIQPGKCSDGMSDKVYAYTAKLLLGATALHGCADRK